jgi:hypothetical protein
LIVAYDDREFRDARVAASHAAQSVADASDQRIAIAQQEELHEDPCKRER